MEVIEKRTFCGFTFLESLKFPISLLLICPNTFENCIDFKSVQFSDSKVKVFYMGTGEIGDCTFAGCPKLKEVNIPNVKKIGKFAFKGDENLEKVDFPKLTTIEKSAFCGCKN